MDDPPRWNAVVETRLRLGDRIGRLRRIRSGITEDVAEALARDRRLAGAVSAGFDGEDERLAFGLTVGAPDEPEARRLVAEIAAEALRRLRLPDEVHVAELEQESPPPVDEEGRQVWAVLVETAIERTDEEVIDELLAGLRESGTEGEFSVATGDNVTAFVTALAVDAAAARADAERTVSRALAHLGWPAGAKAVVAFDANGYPDEP